MVRLLFTLWERKKCTCYYLKIRLIPLDRFLLEMSTFTTLHSPALNNAVLQKNSDWIGVTVAFKCKQESKQERKKERKKEWKKASMVLSNNALYNASIFDADYHLFMISDIKPSSKQKKNPLAWLATNTTDQVSACFLMAITLFNKVSLFKKSQRRPLTSG